MRSGSVLWVLSAAAAVALPARPAHALEAASVMLADGRTLDRVELRPGPRPHEVEVRDSAGRAVVLAAEELLSVDFGKVPGRPAVPTLRLTNGDQIFGKVSFPNARQVKVAAGWGSLTAPLSWCSAIRLNEKAQLPGPVTRDTLILQNDRVEGEIQSVSGGKVNVNLGSGPIPLELSRVHALAFMPRARPTEDRPGLLLGIDLGGGERLAGRWVQLTTDLLTIRLDWGETLDIPVASISRLEVRNGKLVFLSDLKPTEVRHTPYLDGSFPVRADRAVSGRSMRMGGKAFRRGLGVHSRTEVTYTLDGGYQTFASIIGIDDAVGGQGSIIFRVFGDNRLLFESPVVRGGDAPAELKVEVKGVLLLRLEVDFADNGDAADHANWAEARLLRP